MSKNSSLGEGEDYDTGTRAKYRDASVARNYHREFTSFSFSLNNLFVWLVTRGEIRVVRSCLNAIRRDVKTVLDVPCGTGKLFKLFAEANVDAIAGDVSAEMMTIAQAMAAPLRPRIAFALLDATELPLADRSVDVVICLRLLHRIPDDLKSTILAEMSRVSRRYAIISFGISTPWQRLRLRLRRILTGRRTVPFAASDDLMKTMVHGSGWRIVVARGAIPVLSAQRVLMLELSDRSAAN